MRSDKIPEEWAEPIVETWCSDRCTRASERSSDEMRNPNTKKDPEWYRLHFLEKKIVTIIDSINEEGKKKFHAECEYADVHAAGQSQTMPLPPPVDRTPIRVNAGTHGRTSN